MLNSARVSELFRLFTDLGDEQTERWRGFCEAACARIAARVRAGVDVEREMEPLCTAAAAVAYCDYLLLGSAGGESSEIRVGDVSVKGASSTGGDRSDAEGIRDHFLSEVAYLLEPECPALFRAGDAL